MEGTASKPLPQVTPLTALFWEAARNGRLLMQRCDQCDAYVWTPRAHCYECGSDALHWRELSGSGRVHSFTVVRQIAGRGASRAFEADIPYVLVLVDLQEGPRMLSALVGCDIDDVQIDQPVKVTFEQASADIWLPKFTPEKPG